MASQEFHGAGEFDPRINAANPYPRNEELGDWLLAFKALHDRGVRLILDWGALTGSARLDGKIAEARAAAEAAGKDPDKAEMGVRKSPVRSAWQKSAPAWNEVEEHVLRGGWLSWCPEDHAAIELDIDEGDVEATAGHLRGMFHVAGETASVSGKRRLIVRYAGDKRPKKTWRMNGGAGECLANKATICDPRAVRAALDALPEVEPADLSVLRTGGKSKQDTFVFDGEADEEALTTAIEDAAERIEDAPEGEGNNTAAGQAWRAGKAAGTAEGIDVDAARERIARAAEARQPHEAEKARATAERQFDEGVESAADEPFRVRTGGGAYRSTRPGINPAVLENEVVTDEDAAALNRWWQARSHAVEFVAPDITEGGELIPDPHGLGEVKKGELGFVNDFEACVLLGVENAFPDWISGYQSGGDPSLWRFDPALGWLPLPWRDARPKLQRALHRRRYMLETKLVQTGIDENGKPTFEEKYTKKNRPTESSPSAFAATVARGMSGWMPWYTRTEWHDANPWLVGHPDGSCTDVLAGKRRKMERSDLLMKRTAVAPSEWRGSWIEACLESIVPGEADRLTLQCGLGACCIGHAFGEAMIWLIGPGGSGKTSLAEAARAALGEDYCHVIRVERLLDGRRAPSGFGKESSQAALHEARMALVAGEPKADDLLDDGEYKSLTGGGSSEGRRIGMDSKALYGATYNMLGTCNTLPFVKDRDDAVDRRTYAVACPVERGDEHRDASVKARMRQDEHLGALLGFMLEGAHHIAIRGKMPPKTEQQRRRAEFPIRVDEPKAPRDDRAANRRQLDVEAVRTVLEAYWTDGGILWLDRAAEGASHDFIAALEAAARCSTETRSGATRIGGLVRDAGFRTDRKRAGGGRTKRACVIGRKGGSTFGSTFGSEVDPEQG